MIFQPATTPEYEHGHRNERNEKAKEFKLKEAGFNPQSNPLSFSIAFTTQ